MLSSRPVTIATGTRLGPYEILGPLGAGGMGEVYRARDPRLGREVAVKVLPRAVAGDPERQQRFEAEARAAGSINHPNIVTLHDVGLSGDTPYLVTEILDGESLRDLIQRGPLPVARAVAIVIEIAHGLAAAHSKGIVHRDLKPENLFVLPDGRVKILDFGIAKLLRTETSDHAETTPVFASLTVAGTIMGTVSYMAPEQLRDRPVDQRADLFALGAIFHELLTGKQPFSGETAADRVTAILSADPPPTPVEAEREIPGIGAVIARLLAKRPEGRLDTAADLAFTLDLLARRRPSAEATGAAAGGEASGMTAGPRLSFRPLTFRVGEIYCSRFAPDGQTVVYQAAFAGEPSDIFLTRVESPDARPLGLTGANLQSVSCTAEIAVTLRPKDIGGFIRIGTLARVPMIGGRPRELADDVFQATWSPDGKSLAAVRMVDGKCQLEAPLGTVIHRPSGWMSGIRYSPDGRQIAFLNHPWVGSNGGTVCVIRPGEEPRTLTPELFTISNLVWRPDGEEIWFVGYGADHADGVTGVALDGRLRHIYSAPGYPLVEDLAANGDALLTMMRIRMRMETSTRSGGPSAAVDLSWLDWSLVRDMDADGSMVLFDETGAGAGDVPGIFVRPTDGSPAIRLGDGVCASISPDRRYVLAGEIGATKAVTLIPIGAGQARQLATDLAISYGVWLPSGRELVLNGSTPEGGRHLYHMDIESGAVRRLHERPILGQNLVASPDGTRVLARTDTLKIASFPIDGSDPIVYPDLDAVWRPCGFTADSRHFFAFGTGRVPAPILRVDAATGAHEPWMEFVPMARSGVDGINSVRMAANGERYACSYVSNDGTLYHTRGLR